MIFPKDVTESVNRASKLGSGDKVRAMILGYFMINGAIFLIVSPFVSAIGVPLWALLLAQLVISFIIAFYVWRLVIFNEDEKLVEMEQRSSDSFSKYYKLRNIDSGEFITVGQDRIPIFEFDNGSVKLVMRFRFGETNDTRSKNTKKFLEEVYRLIGQNNMEFRQTISTEEFSSSPEARRYMRKISSIEDMTELARAMLDVTHAAFELSDNLSNSDMITLTIRARSGYQKFGLPSLVSQIMNLFSDSITSFRSVEFMYKMNLLDYYKEFYSLKAIDLTQMKINLGTKRLSMGRSSVRVYQVVDESGRVWVEGKVHDQVVHNDMKTARKLDL